MTIAPDAVQQERLRTRGEAQNRDRHHIATLASITAADLARVAPTWNRLAPTPYRGLAAATPVSARPRAATTLHGALVAANTFLRSLTVRDHGQTVTIFTDDNTIFTVEGRVVPFDQAVQSGKSATVTYIERDGVRVATLVAFSSRPPLLPFWFDPASLRYRHGDRGPVPPTAIRSALNIFNANAAAEVAALTAAAGAGELSIPLWQDAMTQAVKDYQLVNAAVGRGGVGTLTDGDLVTVSDTLEFQFGRLDLFADQMEEEVAAATPAAAGARAGNYARSGINLYSSMRRRAAMGVGYDEEINYLGQAEHCQPDPRRPDVADCPGLSRRGWVPIGTLPDIGQRLCLWNCKCELGYRHK